MSDETTLAETPAAEPVDLTTKIESPAAAEVATEQKPATEAAGEVVETEPDGEETEGEPGKKKIPGSQRLKRRLALVEADFLQIQEENARLKQASQATAPKTDGKPGIDREPTEQDFPTDYLAYERAKIAWDVRQAVRDENRKADEARRETTQQTVQTERRREVLAAYEEYADEVRERIPDFDKVLAAAKDVNAKRELAREVIESPKSALLQYYLSKNPDKVAELNNLSGLELAREIGRLETRIHLPKPKTATEASAPPTEVKGGAAPVVDAQTGPDDMNAYVAWRRKQTAKAS